MSNCSAKKKTEQEVTKLAAVFEKLVIAFFLNTTATKGRLVLTTFNFFRVAY